MTTPTPQPNTDNGKKSSSAKWIIPTVIAILFGIAVIILGVFLQKYMKQHMARSGIDNSDLEKRLNSLSRGALRERR